MRGWQRGISWPTVAVLMALIGALVWSTWPIYGGMVRQWLEDPRYSHGLLVPVFALYVLWHRRAMAEGLRFVGSWWGLVPIGLAALLQVAAGLILADWVLGISLLPALAGVALLVGGWRAWRWAWPAIVFLFFMIPLPYRVERGLGTPLQGIATKASTYSLQTLGLPAVSEGHVILLDDYRLGVVDACNGLGMLFLFFAFATGAAMLSTRPMLDRVLMVLSAVPIALAANVARIVVTGLLHEFVGDRWADVVYHDLAGWLMMPMALAALWLVHGILGALLVEVEPAESVSSPLAVPLR